MHSWNLIGTVPYCKFRQREGEVSFTARTLLELEPLLKKLDTDLGECQICGLLAVKVVSCVVSLLYGHSSKYHWWGTGGGLPEWGMRHQGPPILPFQVVSHQRQLYVEMPHLSQSLDGCCCEQSGGLLLFPLSVTRSSRGIPRPQQRNLSSSNGQADCQLKRG